MTAIEAAWRLHEWMDGVAARVASDVALGALLVIAGAGAIVDAGAAPFRDLAQLGGGFFPALIGRCLIVMGSILLLRGVFLRHAPAAPWRLRNFLIAAAIIAAFDVALALDRAGPRWIIDLLLRFGPPEHASVLLLVLAIAVALARTSRLRAVGMALLGLALSAVGLDVVTGELRLTMGLPALIEGVDEIVVLLGLIVVADAAVALVSPSLFLTTYGRYVTGWRPRRIPIIAAFGMRLVAALALASACFYGFELNARAWEAGEILTLGALGVAAKIFAWNRFVLLLACAKGSAFEQAIRHSMLLSSGHAAIFIQRPIAAGVLALAAITLAVTALLSFRRAPWRHDQQRHP